MSCCGRCNCAIEGSDCVEVTGTGRTSDPFVLAPILDPDGVVSCGEDGLYVPPGSVGFGAVASSVYLPGSPPPAAAQIAAVSIPVVNPTDVDALGFFGFTLQSNKNLHGSVSTDVIYSAQFDGGGFGQIVQDLHNLTGAHGSNPAVGGDGTLLVGGRNGLHLNMWSAQHRTSGDIFGLIPALITPGAHTLDLSLDMLFSGLWDDPANPGDNFAVWVAYVHWMMGAA